MAGREIHSSQGLTVMEGFKERKAFNMVLKIKHQKRNKMSKSMKYAKCMTELKFNCGVSGRS